MVEVFHLVHFDLNRDYCSMHGMTKDVFHMYINLFKIYNSLTKKVERCGHNSVITGFEYRLYFVLYKKLNYLIFRKNY